MLMLDLSRARTGAHTGDTGIVAGKEGVSESETKTFPTHLSTAHLSSSHLSAAIKETRLVVDKAVALGIASSRT